MTQKKFDDLDTAILLSLPATRGELMCKHEDLCLQVSPQREAFRTIEARTQAMRRAGLIETKRRGGIAFWETAAEKEG